MKRLLLAVALLAAFVAQGLPAAAETACVPPRCIDVAVKVPPKLTVPDNHVRILLPVDYSSKGPGYPVLYLLHGAGDTYQTWSKNTDLIDLTSRRDPVTGVPEFPVIIVMPDGGRDSNAGWYSDWKDGSRQWETFHIDVLTRYIDRKFNTLGAGHQAVAGLSMGGFGAMSYAARHAGMFQAAASFSGAVDTRYLAPVSGLGFTAFHDRFGTPDDRVWGNQMVDSDEWAAHNPTDRAADLACTALFIASGTGTPGGPAGDDPSNPGGYAIENVIFQMNQSFTRALDKAEVPFESDFYAGGYHGWPYWQRELHWALPQILDVIGSQGTGGPCADARTSLLRVA